MSKEKRSIYTELSRNMDKYEKDYEGFARRSKNIEKNEYINQGREALDFEILQKYGAM